MAGLMAMLTIIISCGGDGSDDTLPNISILENEIHYEAAGGPQTITLKANGTWYLSKGVAWVKATPSSGTASKDAISITMNAEVNIGYEREGMMTFKCGSKEVSVKVSQSGAGTSTDEIITPLGDNWYIFRKATVIESGRSYLFFAKNRIAIPHPSTVSYGYVKTVGVVNNDDHIITQGCNAFILKEEDGGFVIRQISDGRVLYMMDDHNSFQVGAAVPESGHVWGVKVNENGEFVFTNKAKNKTIQYDPEYSTFAAYPEFKGVYPCLYECISETTAPGDEVLTGIPMWMELPETKEDDGLDFYTHSQITDGKSIRSWSFDYDPKALLSHWVAYPLNKALKGSGSRTDEWGYDPKVPISQQPVLYNSYGGAYDRGHQIPSADRLDYDANKKTFYFTNMAPQLAGLNQESWKDLEDKVRTWSESFDTLYVVTGCSIEGSTKVAYDNNGKEVTVPTAYYKALLGYKESGSLGSSAQNGGYIGCAFWFNHEAFSGDFMTKSMSIRELEDKVGVNFFVNLPAKIGEDKAKVVEETKDTWWK